MPADNQIQPYACVVIFDATTLHICAHSNNLQQVVGANAGAVGTEEADTWVDQTLTSLFSPDTILAMRRMADQYLPPPLPLHEGQPVRWGNRQAIVFSAGHRILLEIEPRSPKVYGENWDLRLLEASELFARAVSEAEMLGDACRLLASTLGLDRAMLYQIDEVTGDGIVKYEHKNDLLPSLLGVRFRKEDYPEEAYRLHVQQPVSQYTVSDQPPAALIGDPGEAAQLINYVLGCRTTYTAAKEFVEQIHVSTQVTISLTIRDKVWGVFTCQSREPLYLDYQLRTFARLFGIQVSRDLSSFSANLANRRILDADHLRARIRNNIARASSLVEGFSKPDPSLIDYIPHTGGIAVLVEDNYLSLGCTPGENEVREILRWARQEHGEKEIYYTDHLEGVYPPARDLRDCAAGILLAPLNARRTEWILWLRPEHVDRVVYGSRDGDGKPGERFTKTIEVREGFSLPWTDEQLSSIRDFHAFVRNVVIERYSELTYINRQLQAAYNELEAFSYTVSHDLRAPLRGIDGFAEILMEEYGSKMELDARELIRTIQFNAARMNQFITDILELSRVGRVNLVVNDCDVAQLVRSAVADLTKQLGHPIEVKLQQPLPPLRGDRNQLLLVFKHLLSNAVKYSSKQAISTIEVGFVRRNTFGDGEFYIADNGIGINEDHHQRIFGMFNRLVTNDDYAGSGVGLAVVRRIIRRHNGEVRIESKPGSGATFFFYTDLPPVITGQTI
ncbi:ATP-binding protein [Lewinella sp. JB7]|uniref:ATP-binding protein n=1 Tax=Lewinella sp. JB7 TaxID=2962887 RepID=UPI0020CA0B74|nr:ATP-binding protein [Lewinella sp. JB7]MCP9236745.1 ATP-binding protein [Lewinella sp. JB7]